MTTASIILLSSLPFSFPILGLLSRRSAQKPRRPFDVSRG